MNSGSFKKGEKRIGQGKRGAGKVTLQTREIITAFTTDNAPRLQSWLDAIQEKDGAAAAIAAYTKLLPFALPQLARTELTGQNGGAQEHTYRWLDSRD